MLKVRIIPMLLWNGFTLVKGKNFINERKTGSPFTTIEIYNSRDVDEIIFLDISNKNEEKVDCDFIRSITDLVSVPITIGGGISKISHMEDLFLNGADKISINSETYNNLDLIKKSSLIFGSQAITISIDVRKLENKFVCFANNGKTNTNKNVEDWAKQCEEKGAGEIIINCIDNDGLMNGYELDLIFRLSRTLEVPLIAAGGAGSYDDFYNAYKNGAVGFAAASIYHFTDKTPAKAKKFLKEKNVPIRENFIID